MLTVERVDSLMPNLYGQEGLGVTVKSSPDLEWAVALKYPINLPGWQMIKLLHDSENAIVFLAKNPEGMSVALKVFKCPLEGVAEHVLLGFLTSAQILGSLQSRYLVKVIEADVVDQTAYLAMSYVKGETLREQLTSTKPVSMKQRIRWFLEITEALICLHDAGLLHRDLKSSNVIIDDSQTAVLVDLGVESQLLSSSCFLDEHEIYCTPFYVSPERIIGEAATTQSDLYALGVLLFEILTGEKPIVAGALNEILLAHLLDPVPKLPVELAAFQELLNKLMAKLPENRPDCAKDVLACLPLQL